MQDLLRTIKTERFRRGLSQVAFARRLRCPEWQIAKLETGRDFREAPELLKRVLKALNITDPSEHKG